jgi:hypothetical protein
MHQVEQAGVRLTPFLPQRLRDRPTVLGFGGLAICSSFGIGEGQLVITFLRPHVEALAFEPVRAPLLHQQGEGGDDHGNGDYENGSPRVHGRKVCNGNGPGGTLFP